MSETPVDSASAIKRIMPLEFPYATLDPFLFCVHHDDHYPAGNAEFGPRTSLVGRDLGQDFVIKDGFRMYHGDKVPGFPCHPHRGFETVTVVRNGYVDHSDSMGAAGRYGQGDVQWMTAGAGVQHSEMFPLLDPHHPNRTELFQIWLNLPARSKLTAPHFKMIWAEQVPKRDIVDAAGRNTRVTLVAGAFDGVVPPQPPPSSWASEVDSEVAIWMLRMDAQASFTLPPARPTTNRTLYCFAGSALHIGKREVPRAHLVHVRADVPLTLHAGHETVEILLLQGRPIGEPVVQHGPFVMNSREEIVQTIRDFQRTEFGGWPWQRRDQVHALEQGRFALHSDGRMETPA